MKGAYKAAAFFLAPVLLAKGLDLFLKSESGRKLAARTGNEVLITPEGREIAKKYTGLAVGAVSTAIGATKGDLGEGLRTIAQKRTDWLGVAEDTAAILLATGALIKAISEFARDKRRAVARASAQAAQS